MKPKICVICKGRGFCGLPRCPLYDKFQTMLKLKGRVGKEFEGSSINVFIGFKGYPKVRVGVLSVPSRVEDADAYWLPTRWKEMDIAQILSMRGELIFPFKRIDVRAGRGYAELIKEIGLAKDRVDSFIKLKEKPRWKFTFDANSAPFGPSAGLKQMEVESLKVDHRIERVCEDMDLKAQEGIRILHQKGYELYRIVRVLSSGNLGIPIQRRFVPTRWAIVAVYSSIAKLYMEKVKGYDVLDGFMFGSGSFYGNEVYIILFPMNWSFELIEIWFPRSAWHVGEGIIVTSDHELYWGRKNYAENTGGAYYAVRYAVLRKLDELKVQAGALVIRRITEKYAIPLGVWVVETATERALSNLRRMEWDRIREMVKSIFPFKIESKLMREYLEQRKL